VEKKFGKKCGKKIFQIFLAYNTGHPGVSKIFFGSIGPAVWPAVGHAIKTVVKQGTKK